MGCKDFVRFFLQAFCFFEIGINECRAVRMPARCAAALIFKRRERAEQTQRTTKKLRREKGGV